jgi:hypothetical protein
VSFGFWNERQSVNSARRSSYCVLRVVLWSSSPGPPAPVHAPPIAAAIATAVSAECKRVIAGNDSKCHGRSGVSQVICHVTAMVLKSAPSRVVAPVLKATFADWRSVIGSDSVAPSRELR